MTTFEGWIRLRSKPREMYPIGGRVQLVPGWVAVLPGRNHAGYAEPVPGQGIWAVYPADQVLEVVATVPEGQGPFDAAAVPA